MGPMDWFKEASDFDLEYSSKIQSRLFFSFFKPILGPKAIFFNINHIAMCMCNSSKCWFKHPLR